jgi:hypothetical protein
LRPATGGGSIRSPAFLSAMLLQLDPALLERVGTLLGLPIVGAMVGHLVGRYRRRLATLRWTTTQQPMAFATEDIGWGKVEILYDGRPTKNLHMMYVELQNASSRDLENVLLVGVSDRGSYILRAAGQVRGGAKQLAFSPEYQHVINEANARKLTQPEVAHWAGRGELVVPVLNRGSIVDLKFLISRFDYETPKIELLCEHLGVRVTHQALEAQTLGVRQRQAQLVGLLATVAISVGAVLLNWPNWAIALVALFSGWMAILLGALLARFGRGVLALAD